MEMKKKDPNYEKELRKLNLMIAKQDKIFYMALTVLLNLAEDFNIEKKMKKRKIVSHLTKLLERNDFHLLIVVLLFMRKLSIITENKDQMLEDGLIQKLARFFTCNNNILLQLSLGKYFYNYNYKKYPFNYIYFNKYIYRCIEKFKF